MMDNEISSPADCHWKRFWQSGRIKDYLEYKSAVEQPGAATDEENLHADSNRRAGPAGTQTG